MIPATIMLYPVVLKPRQSCTARTAFRFVPSLYHPRARFLWPGGGSIYLEMPRSRHGSTLTFTPGTYIFSNISLKFTGGTIDCPTCTEY